MQVEIYNLTVIENKINISLEAICDTFSSLLWDIEFYSPGRFEIYIAANAVNISVLTLGRLVMRSDDKNHIGIIENVQIVTDTENGDYLTVSGRFLPCLLERRIIYPTYVGGGTYQKIVQAVITKNCIDVNKRSIPSLALGTVNGECWQHRTGLQVSYDNLMEWTYKICENIGGSILLHLNDNNLTLDLISGTDRSITQSENPHIVFSDEYNNLLSFTYVSDTSVQKNFAYVFGEGEGSLRQQLRVFNGAEPTLLDRYEVYVDMRNSDEESEETDTVEKLRQAGSEALVPPQTASENTIAPLNTQYQYNRDFFVGDYVTVEHKRFELIQEKIQLVGMIESFDQNGRTLTPTFKEG